jgi:hypothetical protein
VTALEDGVARTAGILRRHLSRSMPERVWEVELAHILEIEIPKQSIADTLMLWETQVATTPYPDGFGPWGAHPVWAEESYGIGHTRTFVRILSTTVGTVRHGAEAAGWIRAMQTTDGAFACHAEFERLYRHRHPARAARRDQDARAGCKRATGDDTAATWPHSDLEDAWNALDALAALGSSPRDRDGVIAWLRAHQREDGAFRASPTYDGEGDRYSGPLSDTMYGVRALALVGAEPADAAAVTEWLLAIPEPPLVIPRWAQLETLAALGALARVDRGAELARWQRIELPTDPEELRVSFDAYAALRVKALLRDG